MAKNINFEDVTNYINSLSYVDFKKIVELYATTTKASFDDEMKKLVTLNLQDRLENIGINSKCPKCDSVHISKFGKRNNVQVYKCVDCATKFTRFTNTILEKTHWHWDIWIKVLEMTLNNYSLQDMVNVLEKDYSCKGINIKTVWLWRLKLIHALASLPMPKLTGVIQVDETFIRESQKGSRNLESYIKGEDRLPRYGRRPSKLGVMGPEFATITTAIDNRGYSVCKVSGLGKLTNEMFVDLFDSYFISPSYFCSDANDVYENYCQLRNIPHYIKPSNYITIIEKNGYETPDFSNPAKAKATRNKNEKILASLYSKDMIDKISNRGYIPYTDFIHLKNANSLSLARVNELHSDIKKFINSEMTNVSTKYLQDYIGYFTYIRNWRVTNGHYPTSTKDAEALFIEILKCQVNYTTTEIKAEVLDLPKPTGRYVALLKEETEKARIATSNKYFKFDEEDGVKSFNKREYLFHQPKYKLHNICKDCKVKHYKQLSLWTIVSEILKQPNIDDIIYNLIQNDRHYKISEEDLEAIRDSKFYA